MLVAMAGIGSTGRGRDWIALSPDFGTAVIMMAWLGGLSLLLALLAFVTALGPMERPFWKGPLVPVMKGFAGSWAAGVLLAVLWHFDVVSSDFMDAAPLIALVATVIGGAKGLLEYRWQKELDLESRR